MKVGIFTFHYGYNYGAKLQCLALCRTLQNLGVDAEIIQYVPADTYEAPVWYGWGIRNRQTVENLRLSWIAARHRGGMKKAYDNFRNNYFTFSPACTSPEEIAKVVSGVDALITGSDQVWHFAQKAPYFLEWSPPYTGKRISYAPCCGTIDQPQDRMDQIKTWLSRFDHLSVRNQFSKDIIQPLVGTPVSVVADPSLLTDLSDVQQPVELPDAYILTYTLGDQIKGGHLQALDRLRQEIGDLPVVAVIPSAGMPHLAPWADLKIWEAGPAEWLHLVANAQFVYTDSFHGALFSMKYKKPFLAYYTEEGRAPRLLDLANRYAVEHAVAGSLSEAVENEFWTPVDYHKTQELMSEHAEMSLDYLRRALDL